MEVHFRFLQKSAFNKANLSQISARTNIVKCFSDWLLLIFFIDVSMVVLEFLLTLLFQSLTIIPKNKKKHSKMLSLLLHFFFSSIEKIPIT